MSCFQLSNILITDNNYIPVTMVEKKIMTKQNVKLYFFKYVMSFQAVAWGRSWTFEHKGVAES